MTTISNTTISNSVCIVALMGLYVRLKCINTSSLPIDTLCDGLRGDNVAIACVYRDFTSLLRAIRDHHHGSSSHKAACRGDGTHPRRDNGGPSAGEARG